MKKILNLTALVLGSSLILAGCATGSCSIGRPSTSLTASAVPATPVTMSTYASTPVQATTTYNSTYTAKY